MNVWRFCRSRLPHRSARASEAGGRAPSVPSGARSVGQTPAHGPAAAAGPLRRTAAGARVGDGRASVADARGACSMNRIPRRSADGQLRRTHAPGALPATGRGARRSLSRTAGDAEASPIVQMRLPGAAAMQAAQREPRSVRLPPVRRVALRNASDGRAHQRPDRTGMKGSGPDRSTAARRFAGLRVRSGRRGCWGSWRATTTVSVLRMTANAASSSWHRRGAAGRGLIRCGLRRRSNGSPWAQRGRCAQGEAPCFAVGRRRPLRGNGCRAALGVCGGGNGWASAAERSSQRRISPSMTACRSSRGTPRAPPALASADDRPRNALSSPAHGARPMSGEGSRAPGRPRGVADGDAAHASGAPPIERCGGQPRAAAWRDAPAAETRSPSGARGERIIGRHIASLRPLRLRRSGRLPAQCKRSLSSIPIWRAIVPCPSRLNAPRRASSIHQRASARPPGRPRRVGRRGRCIRPRFRDDGQRGMLTGRRTARRSGVIRRFSPQRKSSIRRLDRVSSQRRTRC